MWKKSVKNTGMMRQDTFTSGPKGSEAYENQIWETSGEEAALWDKFHIATPAEKEKS